MTSPPPCPGCSAPPTVTVPAPPAHTVPASYSPPYYTEQLVVRLRTGHLERELTLCSACTVKLFSILRSYPATPAPPPPALPASPPGSHT